MQRAHQELQCKHRSDVGSAKSILSAIEELRKASCGMSRWATHCADVLPAGRYASLVYTGIENGITGNRALIEWAAAQGIQWDRWDAELGDAFGGRVECMLDGPEDDPDPANRKTEVAIKLADNQAR